jgi:hypothetical protein
MKKEGTFMNTGPNWNRVTIYRLPPEEVEQLLAAKFGGKIVAVNALRLARVNQKRDRYAEACQKSDII